LDFHTTYLPRTVAIKQLLGIYDDWDSLRAMLGNELDKRVSTLAPCRSEGFVLEDASGFMFKVKDKSYRFWKYMRTMAVRVNNIVRGHGREQQIREKLHTENEHKVVNWMLDNPGELDIIKIRNAYQKDNS